ncbi:MAG TPA: hypothetical protein VHV53_08175 [Solirubrobacterales bacterium]|nr:hypothetical protein [Solirubrobacterales bacterium]
MIDANDAAAPPGTDSDWSVCRYGAVDEILHDPGTHELYNESVYFNFMTGLESGPLGGVLRIGLRPGEGYAELSLNLPQDDGTIIFLYERNPLDYDGFEVGSPSWRSGGMTAAAIVPTRRWRLRFEGDGGRAIRDPAGFGRDPGKTLRAGQRLPCALDLEFVGSHPIYALSESGDLVPDKKVDYAKNHYEQVCTASGTIEIGASSWRIEAQPGFRDHSWGPRDWQSTPWTTFVTAALDDGEYLVAVSQRLDGTDYVRGVSWSRDGMAEIVRYDVISDYAGAPELTEPLKMVFAAGDRGEIELDAKIDAYLPLRHRKGNQTIRTAQALLTVSGAGRRGVAWTDITRPADG